MPGYGGGGSALGGFASGLNDSLQAGAGHMRNVKNDQRQWQLYMQQMQRAGQSPGGQYGGYGGSTDVDYDAFGDPTYSTAVGGQEPPEDIMIDQDGGATAGYGGPGSQPTGGARPMMPQGAQGLRQNQAGQHHFNERAGRMHTFDQMQKTQTQMTGALQQKQQEAQMRAQAGDAQGAQLATMEAKNILQQLRGLQGSSPMKPQMAEGDPTYGPYTGAAKREPTGSPMETQKGLILRDVQTQHPEMEGAAIDYLGNSPGSTDPRAMERNYTGARDLRAKWDEEMKGRAGARPRTPHFHQYKGFGGGNY